MTAGTIRLGLMGFGRVGRALFRLLYDDPRFEVAAIAEIADHEALEYLLRFSTVYGRFPSQIAVHDGCLFAGGRGIPILSGDDDVRWSDVGADVVIELRPRSQSRSQLERHLEGGARRVVLCVPPLDPPDITAIVGINDDALRAEHRIVSNASCTAHCAAPLLKILDEAFGVERAFLSSVHAFGNRSRLADVPAADRRSGRAAGENIIPQETNAGSVLEDLLPQLRGRLRAHALHVPVANGSLVDLVAWHREPVTTESIGEAIRAASWGGFRDQVVYETEPIVSSDVRARTATTIVDAQSTMALGDRVSKTISWFDNTHGYLEALKRLLVRLHELDGREAAA